MYTYITFVVVLGVVVVVGVVVVGRRVGGVCVVVPVSVAVVAVVAGAVRWWCSVCRRWCWLFVCVRLIVCLVWL